VRVCLRSAATRLLAGCATGERSLVNPAFG
jgi:hypothetical protein